MNPAPICVSLSYWAARAPSGPCKIYMLDSFCNSSIEWIIIQTKYDDGKVWQIRMPDTSFFQDWVRTWQCRRLHWRLGARKNWRECRFPWPKWWSQVTPCASCVADFDAQMHVRYRTVPKHVTERMSSNLYISNDIEQNRCLNIISLKVNSFRLRRRNDGKLVLLNSRI